MDGGLLVTHQHMAQARLGVERVVQRQHGAAGVAKIVSTPCAISVSNRIRAPLAAGPAAGREAVESASGRTARAAEWRRSFMLTILFVDGKNFYLLFHR